MARQISVVAAHDESLFLSITARFGGGPIIGAGVVDGCPYIAIK
jgi:hypothetical protein